MARNFTEQAVLQQAAEVCVEKLVYGGDGLARLNGQIVFLPYVLPGERVLIHPDRAKAGVLRSTKSTILQPASERVTARCEYFSTCGGCQYQHSQYVFQLEQKVAILRETMQRLGGLTFNSEIRTISGHPWSYRNRIQLHFENDRLGFHKEGSNELCSIDHCEIASPKLGEAITILRQAVQDSKWPRFLRSLELFTNEQQLQLVILDSDRPIAMKFFDWCASILPSTVPGPIDYVAAGHAFRISRGSFFQVNRFLIDEMVEEALGDANGDRAVDLYAGVGLFSLKLAERFKEVQSVERGGPAYRDLQWNTQAYQNVAGFRSSSEDFLRTVESAPDLVVADPPRAGLDRAVTEELLRVCPQQLVIVSCDPATLSRDLKKLLTIYQIDRIALIDLFPQTYHFETVVHLRLG